MNDPTQKVEVEPSVKSHVAKWLGRISAAEKRWKADFDRMRDDMKFAQGLQRPDQTKMDEDAYLVNLCIRIINQKVASLYARNPIAEWQRRKRMDFQIWDENPESLLPLVEKSQVGLLEMPDMALLNDYINGMQMRQLVEKIGQTLEILYQYQIDEHDPNFKLQLKALVRRVATCGVGYVRVGFARDEASLLTEEAPVQAIDRAKRAQSIMETLVEDGVSESDARYQELKSLFNSVGVETSGQYDDINLSERLVFDFLSATSVIPDKNCKQLKGFVGARFIAIKRRLPLEEVAAFFEKRDLPSSTVKKYDGAGRAVDVNDKTNVECDDPQIDTYEVMDKSTKTVFFVAEGYDDYLSPPETFEPCVTGFWPILSLTFNDVEVEADNVLSIFPPSDVQLIKHAQKEWNRTRQELRQHRKSNSPRWVTGAGWLEEDDITALQAAQPNSVVQLKSIPPNGDITKSIMALPQVPIDPNLYSTEPLLQDILLAVGAQEANMGPAPGGDSTATGQTIAEQSRTISLSSNVDDLDDFLSQVARVAGDIALQSFSEEVVKRIVGIGAVWPVENREDFLNEVFLKIVAASSGRPNKALEIANWQQAAGILQQSGANPMFMVKETLKRVDDRIDVADAFPLNPAMLGAAPQGVPAANGRPPTPNGNVPQQGRPGPGKVGERTTPGGQPLASGQPTRPL